MHTEVVSIPKLFEHTVTLRGVLPEPAWSSAIAWPPPIVTVVGTGRICGLPGGCTHIVQTCKFVQRIAPNDRHPNRPPKLLLS